MLFLVCDLLSASPTPNSLSIALRAAAKPGIRITVEGQWGKLHSCYTDMHTQGALCMIAPPMPPDREFILTRSGVPRRALSYYIKMPFSSVTDAEIIGQLCYIIVKPAGTPLVEEALSFPVSVSKLGSRAGSLSSATLTTYSLISSARMGSAIATCIFP